MEVPISFKTDGDGFVSQECPACSSRFKVKLGEGSPEPISFCPYCCHMGRDCWWTPEQVTYIHAVSKMAAADLASRELEKMAKQFNRGNSGLVKMKMSTSRTRPSFLPSAPQEIDVEMLMIEFGCCGELIKHDGSAGQLFCIICGTQHLVIGN